MTTLNFIQPDAEPLDEVVYVDSHEAARLLQVGRGKFECLLKEGEVRPVTHPRTKRRFALADIRACRRRLARERNQNRPSWAS